jgi:hypothetical protein
MPKIVYVPKKFGSAGTFLIESANQIIEDYTAQGYKLTLRQLYYQFVARDLFPDDRRWSWTGSKWIRDPNGTKNAEPNYKWIGELVNDGRLAGLIDWEALEDRTRSVRSLPHWNNPSEILEACANQYRRDKWEDQTYRPKVWIEKDALVGVIEGVCNEFDVPYFSCRGYTSQSEMWAAAQTIREEIDQGYTPIIFHFGDHDPSGIDMTRDITDRLEMFMGGIEVKRLALNMPQINEINPPPSPAKITDSRATAYIAEYGADSWELDALEPSVLVELVRSAILSIRDESAWTKSVNREKRERNRIKTVAREI